MKKPTTAPNKQIGKEAKAVDSVRDVISASSRRGFIAGGLGVLATGATQLVPSQVDAQQSPGMLERLTGANGRPILLKGGLVLSMDSQVGDFENGDVLIQGKKIVSVGRNSAAPANAIVVDAARMIIMPGFIDTHHHQFEDVLRSILADGLWGFQNDMLPKNNYVSVMANIFFPQYLPEDGYIAQLVASLSQINAGVITTVDTSQVHLTPAHTDATIAGLKESGRRAILSYRAEAPDNQVLAKTKEEIIRLQKQYFSSKDQLLTLASNAAVGVEEFQLARSLGLPTVSHAPNESINESLAAVAKAGLLGPDHEYIHCTRLKEPGWKLIADSGGKLSIATAIEMQMKHGMPPVQAALDHGIRPSLSVDVECNMTADLFSVMRATFLIQRALVGQRSINGEQNVPAMLTCRDVIDFATVQGAKTTHLDSKIGTLTPGKEADIIMLATDRINVFPLNNVPGSVVTLMDTSNVEHVFIAGKVAKWQGKLVGVDLTKLRREIEKSRDGLLARTKFPRELFGTCCPGPWTKGGV